MLGQWSFLVELVVLEAGAEWFGNRFLFSLVRSETNFNTRLGPFLNSTQHLSIRRLLYHFPPGRFFQLSLVPRQSTMAGSLQLRANLDRARRCDCGLESDFVGERETINAAASFATAGRRYSLTNVKICFIWDIPLRKLRTPRTIGSRFSIVEE